MCRRYDDDDSVRGGRSYKTAKSTVERSFDDVLTAWASNGFFFYLTTMRRRRFNNNLFDNGPALIAAIMDIDIIGDMLRGSPHGIALSNNAVVVPIVDAQC